MGSDMIERVARAIAEEAAMWGDEATRPEVRHALARAAIAAMREPTEAMVEAGGSVELRPLSAAYTAMIDAALEPPNGPAAPIWRKAGALLAEGDAMIDAAIERAEKAPNGPARRDPAPDGHPATPETGTPVAGR